MLHTPEILAGNGTDLTMLERQRARLKWQQQQQQQQQQQSYYNVNDAHFNLLPLPSTAQQLQDLISNEAMKRELENGWPDFGSSLVDYSLSRTSSCQAPMVDNAIAPAPVTVKKGSEMSLASTVGKENMKKRKADKAQNTKVTVAEDTRDKKIKLDAEEDSKVTDQNNSNNRESSSDSAKENSKVTEVQKPDYIHVRARRGQATDSHSLAERVRREKISERMKYLQDLVPGCNKITGKAGMLDEIINYVQSLQRQVEFLSMKLAAVNPRLDFNIDNFLAKEMFPTCADNFPTTAISSEVPNCSAYLPFDNNPVQQQQVVSCCGFDMVASPQEMARTRTISAPVSLPETLLDSSCFTQVQLSSSSSPWETDLQSLYNVDFSQGRPIGFQPQSFAGNLETNNLKMEM